MSDIEDIVQDYNDDSIEEGPNGIPSEDGSVHTDGDSEMVDHISENDNEALDDQTDNSPCGSCPNCSANTYSPNTYSPSSSENPFARVDIKTILDTINTLVPLLSNNFGERNNCNPVSNIDQNLVDLVKQYHSLCDGLPSIRNDQLRAICFMDRLINFHNYFWGQLQTNGDIENTTSDLIKRQIQSEISNVMEQLTQ